METKVNAIEKLLTQEPMDNEKVIKHLKAYLTLLVKQQEYRNNKSAEKKLKHKDYIYNKRIENRKKGK